jgi:hypothetical protein
MNKSHSRLTPKGCLGWIFLVLTFIGLQYGDVIFGGGSLNTLAYSPAGAPYAVPPAGGALAGSWLDRFPKGMTAHRAFWDLPLVYEPNFLAAHRAIRAGNFPWLNPSLALGAPLFGNGIDASFNIATLSMLLLDNSNWSLVYIALYCISATLIFRLFTAYYGLSSPSATIGVIIFISSGLFVPQISYGGEILNVHTFVWSVFFLEKFFATSNARNRSASAIGLILSLTQASYAGMPEGTVAVFSMVGLLFGVRMLAPLRSKGCLLSWTHIRSDLIWGTVIFSIALFLSGPYLITLFHYSTLMPHGHEVGHYTLPLFLLPDLIVPYLHGWTLHSFFGPETDNRLNVVFVGIIPLILAILGAFSDREATKRTLGWSFGLIALFYLSQSFGSPHRSLNFMGSVPVLNKVFFFRFFAPLFVLAIAALSALSAERIVQASRLSRAWLRLCILWILLLSILALIASLRAKIESSVGHTVASEFLSWTLPNVVLYLILGLTLSMLILSDYLGFIGKWFWAKRSGLLVVLTLVISNYHFSKSFFRKQGADEPVPFIRFLQERALRGPPFRVFSQELFFPGTASSYGLEDIRHMNPVVPRRFAQFVSAVFGPLAEGKVSWERFERLNITNQSDYTHPGFDLLNVRFFVFPASERNLPSGNRFRIVFKDSQATIIENLDAQPRAWIAKKVTELSTEEEIYASIRRAPEQLESIVFTAKSKTTSNADATLPAFEQGQSENDKLKLSTTSGAGYQLSVNLSGWRLLVVGDLYQEGFVATSAGNPLGMLPVDGGLIGIVAPPGSYDIELRYSAPFSSYSTASFTIGFIALIGIALRLRNARIKSTSKLMAHT